MEEKSSGATRDFGAVVAHHREYFRSGNTRPAKWREAQLTSLQAMVTERADDIAIANPVFRVSTCRGFIAFLR